MPTTATADNAILLEQERQKIGKTTQNPFANNMNFLLQSVGPVSAETATQMGNTDASAVIAATVTGWDDGTTEINQFNPYNTPYAYTGIPTPYSPYIAAGTLATTSSGNMVSGSTQAMTVSSTPQNFTSGTTGSYSATTGMNTDLQAQMQQMQLTQMSMMAIQAQMGEISVQGNALSNIMSNMHNAQMNTIRNLKMG